MRVLDVALDLDSTLNFAVQDQSGLVRTSMFNMPLVNWLARMHSDSRIELRVYLVTCNGSIHHINDCVKDLKREIEARCGTVMSFCRMSFDVVVRQVDTTVKTAVLQEIVTQPSSARSAVCRLRRRGCCFWSTRARAVESARCVLIIDDQLSFSYGLSSQCKPMYRYSGGWYPYSDTRSSTRSDELEQLYEIAKFSLKEETDYMKSGSVQISNQFVSVLAVDLSNSPGFNSNP